VCVRSKIYWIVQEKKEILLLERKGEKIWFQIAPERREEAVLENGREDLLECQHKGDQMMKHWGI
jgi:hypothetical protein